LDLMGKPEKTIERAACRHHRHPLDSACHTAGSEVHNPQGVGRARRRLPWKTMMMLLRSFSLAVAQLLRGAEDQLQPKPPV
jgi:hypothetical protein